MQFFPSCNVLGRILRAIQGEHVLSGGAASFVARTRQEGRLPGWLEAWSSKEFSFARAVPLICATGVHMMNLNNLILGECKQLKDENLCIWKDLPQRFPGLGRGGPLFTGETRSFLQSVDFRACDLEGQKGDSTLETCQWTAMLVQSISRVSSTCDSSLFIYCQNHPSNQYRAGTVRRGRLPWGADRGRVLVRQSPCPAGAQQWLWQQIPTSLRHTPKNGWTTAALIRLCQVLGSRLQRKMCTSGWLPKEEQRK